MHRGTLKTRTLARLSSARLTSASRSLAIRSLAIGACALAASILTSATLTSPAQAGPITLAAFGPGSVVRTFNNLGINDAGPSIQIIAGDTISVSGTSMRYAAFLGDGQQFGTPNDTGTMTIVLGTDVARAGLEVGTTAAATETVRFFDASHNLLGEVFVTNPDIGLLFAGWETTGALIHSLEIQDTAANSRIMLVDNLITQATVDAPEPASLAVFGLGLAAVAGIRRRHRR